MSSENKTTDKTSPEINPGKNALAALAAGLFVLGIGLLAFNYFNNISKDTPRTPQQVDRSSDIIASSTQRDVEEDTTNQDTNTQQNSPVITNETVAGAMTDNQTTWTATDYKQGDLGTGSYTVRDGDTLWEISEAVYGNGGEWTKILNANAGNIGSLPNGQQALIVTGQVLAIPS